MNRALCDPLVGVRALVCYSIVPCLLAKGNCPRLPGIRYAGGKEGVTPCHWSIAAVTATTNPVTFPPRRVRISLVGRQPREFPLWCATDGDLLLLIG